MTANDQQLTTTLERIAWFQKQVAQLRATETCPLNYRAAVPGCLAQIDRMLLDVRKDLRFRPAAKAGAA